MGGYTRAIFDSSFVTVSSFPFRAFSKRAWAGELEMEGLEKCWRSFRRESHLILVEILQLEMRHKSALTAVKHGIIGKHVSFDLFVSVLSSQFYLSERGYHGSSTRPLGRAAQKKLMLASVSAVPQSVVARSCEPGRSRPLRLQLTAPSKTYFWSITKEASAHAFFHCGKPSFLYGISEVLTPSHEKKTIQ